MLSVFAWLRNQVLHTSDKPGWLQAAGLTPNPEKIAAGKAGMA